MVNLTLKKVKFKAFLASQQVDDDAVPHMLINEKNKLHNKICWLMILFWHFVYVVYNFIALKNNNFWF